jgi:hypothetical protein
MTGQRPPQSRHRSFSRELEQVARDLIAGAGSANSPVTRLLAQNIALTLEQLDSTRRVHQDQLLSLTRAECYVDTEIIQVEQDRPRYAPMHDPVRERLHHRLFLIETERRKETLAHEERVRGLQRHLLSLIQKHGQLKHE